MSWRILRNPWKRSQRIPKELKSNGVLICDNSVRWDVQLKTQSCATLTAAGISNSGKVPRDPKGVEFALICMMKLANSFARHVTRGRLRYVVTRQSKYNEGKTVQTKETRSPFKEEEEEEGGRNLHIVAYNLQIWRSSFCFRLTTDGIIEFTVWIERRCQTLLFGGFGEGIHWIISDFRLRLDEFWAD